MMLEIEGILRQSIGLETSSVGAATVEQAVRGRMGKLGGPTGEEYLQRLRESPGEMAELIEAIVVPESWFFRDGAPFVALARWVREEWQPAHPGETLRVLTVPCSTGEEPYSAAMALLDAGLPPGGFTIDAVDISRRALDRARRAIYGPNSFRGRALDFRERHFAEGPEGYALAENVRRQVRFEAGNLLAADFRPGWGRFDVVFCRNLLIYFDRPTQALAIKALTRLLAPDGILFVGHAESHAAVTAGFEKANYPQSFAFRRAAAAAPRPPSTVRLAPVSPPVRTSPVKTTRLALEMPGPAPARIDPLPPAAAAPKPDDLETARTLADQGKLEEAGRLCEQHLRQHGASAAAWFLLGVVRDAAGDARAAAACFTKTCYLQPDHQEALLQNALLAEQNGDAAAAAQLRRRIARVQQRGARS